MSSAPQGDRTPTDHADNMHRTSPRSAWSGFTALGSGLTLRLGCALLATLALWLGIFWALR